MSKEVVICPECKGEGQMAYIENRETHVDKCKTCTGYRVVYKVTRYEPLVKTQDKLFNR